LPLSPFSVLPKPQIQKTRFGKTDSGYAGILGHLAEPNGHAQNHGLTKPGIGKTTV
jgi:hypothetical protein